MARVKFCMGVDNPYYRLLLKLLHINTRAFHDGQPYNIDGKIRHVKYLAAFGFLHRILSSCEHLIPDILHTTGCNISNYY